jgi:hypothetical protein
MSRHRLVAGMMILGLGSLAVLWVSRGTLSRASARPPATKARAQQPETPPAPAASASDYSHRVVAYIYGTIPITREELGEYLIARMGPERLQALVNRRIIEHACKEKGVDVTAAEIEADLTETVRSLNTTRKEFEAQLLKPHNKTLYEWKEDAIRPRLLLTKMCRDRVHVADEDLQMAFEAYYGEKIDCRIIMWPLSEQAHAMKMYPKIRDSEMEFERAAKTQASPTLAAAGGQVKPFGRHTAGNDKVEKAAFMLQPGELSQLLETPEGYVVLKCVKRILPDTSKKLADVRDTLAKEVFDKKLQQEIPKYFKELSDQAQPNLILQTMAMTEEQLMRRSQELLKEDATSSPSKLTPPHGN